MQSMTLLAVFAGLFGLCIGSFLNVVAWRVPLGRSIVSPGSACPSCGRPIRWHENIPVLGYLLLLGRCRGCRARISPLYPAVELATGLLFAMAMLKSGATAGFASDAVFLSLMIVTVRTDLEKWIVLDEVSLGGAAAGILFSLLPGGLVPLESLAAATGAFLLFLFIRLASLAVLRGRPGYIIAPRGQEEEEEFTGGMGWGDVKLAACIGAFLGPAMTVVALFTAFVTGAVVGVAVMAGGRSRRVPIPFGPFMAFGSAVAVFAGRAMFDAYLGAAGLGG
jgi:leader peptidase (prepilin peptidase)/N-methyltransferase